jgi:hypothetical protein
MIWEAGRKYCELAAKDRALILVFIVWFVATNSEISEQYREQPRPKDWERKRIAS